MNILYVSRMCSIKMFNELYNLFDIKPQQQAQKFHHLLAVGLSSIKAVQLYALSSRPVSKERTKIKWLGKTVEKEDKINFVYLPYTNLLGHFYTFFAALFETVKWCLKNTKKESVIITDALNLSLSFGAKVAAFFCRVKTIAIVTDIPYFMIEYTNKNNKSFKMYIYTLLSTLLLKRYDGYVLLTDQMNELINPRKKPYIVIEGLVDSKLKDMENKIEEKYYEKVVIYAGSLHKKYGVLKLIEAFMKVPINDARLWIFGSGDAEKEIIQYEKRDRRIKYYGVLPNEEVVKHQIKATLLVNPRPSNEEFTKYSFPSKNMEYMASGTPILTTPLPGMPLEYNDYVYLFTDESVDGMANRLYEILDQSPELLHEKGRFAKKFVMENKSNIIQSERLYSFLNNYLFVVKEKR